MKRKLVIKSFKVNANSNDSISKVIVVGYNTTKVNGRYIEKLGVCSKYGSEFFYFLKLSRLGFWINRGAKIKPRISWIVGMLGRNLLKNDFKKK